MDSPEVEGIDSPEELAMAWTPAENLGLNEEKLATESWVPVVAMPQDEYGHNPWLQRPIHTSPTTLGGGDDFGGDDDNLKPELQVQSRRLKSSQVKRPSVPRLKLNINSTSPSRVKSLKELITPSWWESKANKMVFGSRETDSEGKANSHEGARSGSAWHDFSDLRPSARSAGHRLTVQTARERRAPPQWDGVGLLPSTARPREADVGSSGVPSRGMKVPPRGAVSAPTSVRMRELPLQTLSRGLSGGGVSQGADERATQSRGERGRGRDEVVCGYRHPYGLTFGADSALRCPFGPGTAGSGLFPATPRTHLTSRSDAGFDTDRSRKSSRQGGLRPQDLMADAVGSSPIESRRLTNTPLARTRAAEMEKQAEHRALEQQALGATERRARSSWMPAGAAGELKEEARRHKTLGAIERLLHLAEGAGRAQLRALYKRCCGRELDVGEDQDLPPGAEADHVQGLLDLMVELEVLALVDVRTGLRVRERSEGQLLRREDGLLSRAELYQVLQGTLAGLPNKPRLLSTSDVATCLKIIADRALHRAGSLAQIADDEKRERERREREAREKAIRDKLRARQGPAEKQAAAAAAAAARRSAGAPKPWRARLLQPGPYRGKPQRLVEAEANNLRTASDDSYTIRLFH